MSTAATSPPVLRRYNDLLRSLPQEVENKVIYLPYDVSAISGIIAQLPSVYGRHANSQVLQSAGADVPGAGARPVPVARGVPTARGPAARPFADLE